MIFHCLTKHTVACRLSVNPTYVSERLSCFFPHKVLVAGLVTLLVGIAIVFPTVVLVVFGSFVKLLGAGSNVVALVAGVVFVVAIHVALVLCVVETAVLFSSASLFAVSHHVTGLSPAGWLCAVNFAGITFVATAKVVAGLFAVFSLGAFRFTCC